MILKELLDEIQKNFSKWQNYEVYVVRFDTKLENVTDDHEIEEFAVLDINIEDEEKEINIITNEFSKASNSKLKPLTVKELANRLETFMPKHSDYSIFSGSSMVEIGNEYSVRLDTPIVSFGWSDENKRFVLLQKESTKE